MRDFFHQKTANRQKLIDYGFSEVGGVLVFEDVIADGELRLAVSVDSSGVVRADTYDVDSGEPYTLYRSEATGAFVGSVRTTIEDILSEISESCFDPDVFKSECAKRIIAHVREEYGEEPEYLWKNFPNNAILRRRDNRKWYAALLTTRRKNIGASGDEDVEIIDLRGEPETIRALIDGKKYFPGWHMNKKHWFTMCMDAPAGFDEICSRLKESRDIAARR